MKLYKVLIVEDERIIRKGLIFSFDWEEVNCVVVGEAENGQEGLEKIAELKPDIVIADINLPIMNGIAMIEKTIDECQYSAIIVSGYSEFEYAKKAMKYGVTEYLLKPLNHVELKEAINKAIERREIRNIYNKVRKNKLDTAEVNVLDYDLDFEGSDGVLKKMLEYTRNKYMDKIVMSDISKYLNYSETLLNRKFKEKMKTTYNDYLNRFRIQKTIEMIREGNLYIYDIAERCGFNNYKYFNIVFKKYVGCSAKEFAQLMKKDTSQL
jgi:two-component system response regulator YesN